MRTRTSRTVEANTTYSTRPAKSEATVQFAPPRNPSTPPVVASRKSKPRKPKLPMETVFHTVHLSDPDGARPVNARWQIARALVDRLATPRNFRRVLDDYVKKAVDYIKASEACKSEHDVARLAKRMPHLHEAHLLHVSKDKLARGLVEARLLAGMSVEQTAIACKLPQETVEWYEALFFRVVGLLRHRLYIMSQVFGRFFHEGLTEDHVDVIVKRAGYLKGPMLIDQFVKYYAYDWRAIADIPNLSADQLKELISMIEIHSVILAWVLPFEKMRPVFQFMELNDQLRSVLKDLVNGEGRPQPVAVDLSLSAMANAEVGASVPDCARREDAVDGAA